MLATIPLRQETRPEFGQLQRCLKAGSGHALNIATAQMPGAGPEPARGLERMTRLTALATACCEAVTMFGSVPTPQTVRPSTSHST